MLYLCPSHCTSVSVASQSPQGEDRVYFVQHCMYHHLTHSLESSSYIISNCCTIEWKKKKKTILRLPVFDPHTLWTLYTIVKVTDQRTRAYMCLVLWAKTMPFFTGRPISLRPAHISIGCVFLRMQHIAKAMRVFINIKKLTMMSVMTWKTLGKKKRKTLFAKCKKSIQKTTRCVIPHTQNVQERRTHQDRSRADVARAVERGPANEHRMSFL